ncbi:hypothetical protein [Ekhidna sp.]
MKEYLENIAADQGWLFVHGREDYFQYDNNDVNNPMNMGTDDVFIGLDPITAEPNISQNSGVRQSNRWTGRFMIMMRSDIDESYKSKYDNYISVVDEHLKTIEKKLTCAGLTINRFSSIDGINRLFENCDGKIVTFDVTIENNAGIQPNRLTTLTLSSNSETLASGEDITPIDITTDQDSNVTIEGDIGNLTLTKNNSRSWQIAGTISEELNFSVKAQGVFGGYKAQSVDIDLSGMATPITDVVANNNGQIIWNKSGNGLFIDVEFSSTPSEADYTLDDTNLPSGLQLIENKIQLSDFTLIPIGENTFGVDWTAGSGYSGSGTVLITITKREVKKPNDIFLTQATLQNWYDHSLDDGEFLTVVGDYASAAIDRSAAGYDVDQNSSSQYPIVVNSKVNGKRCLAFLDDNLDNNSVDTSTDYWVFTVVQQGAISNNQYLFRSIGNDVRIAFDRAGRMFIRAGGVTGYYTIDDLPLFVQSTNLIAVRITEGSADIYINGDFKGSVTIGTAVNLTGQFIYMAFQDSTNALSIGGFACEFLVGDNTGSGLTTSDREEIEGYLADKWGVTLVAGHNYENQPALK